jgi:hypothetical protein
MSAEAVTPVVAINVAPFTPQTPSLTADPITVFDPVLAGAATNMHAARRLVAEATAIGTKWRFDYLKAQATKAAFDTMVFENYIAQLMAMTVTKVSARAYGLPPACDHDGCEDCAADVREHERILRPAGSSHLLRIMLA